MQNQQNSAQGQNNTGRIPTPPQPPQGYGAWTPPPPPPGAYGASMPPQPPQGYGAWTPPPPPGVNGAGVPPQQGGYGAWTPPPTQGAYGVGMPPQQGGYGSGIPQTQAGAYSQGTPIPTTGQSGAVSGQQQDDQPVVPIGKFGREGSFKARIKIPKHNLKFDEEYFLRLLAGSISLSKDEKKRIIESIPKLSQYQIDELIKIFEEEKRKFSELDVKHKEQLESLESKHASEWESLEMEQEQGAAQQEENTAVDDIRKSLGISD